MNKYLSFFRLRFSMGLQYKAAALAGIATQFFWGLMEILVFQSFYRSDASSFPMEFFATASYIWLQQAFLALFMTWMMETEIFDSITNGSIAYELCRPIDLYDMWFSRSLAYRLSRAVLRCMPILIIALLLPKPWGLSLPVSPMAFLLFLASLILGLLVTVSFCLLIYIACFYTISSIGIRMVAVSVVEFFSGSIIPLPFFPSSLRQVMELLPFAAMQNVPLRIYSGDLSGQAMEKALLLQILWLAVLLLMGKGMSKAALKKVVVQGG